MTRALLIGLGRIGWRGFAGFDMETHAATILSHPRLKLAAGVDVDPMTRLEFQETTHLPVYESIQAACKIEAPEIIVIATPANTHTEVALACAPYGKALVIEKPMAQTVAECERIASAWKGRPILVGHQRRYEQRHILLRAFLKSKVLGEPRRAFVEFSGDFLNNGVHATDLLSFMQLDGVPSGIYQREWSTFTLTVGCERGNLTLSSYGDLEPGYMTAMYDDLLNCMESGHDPVSNHETGKEAVRFALMAEEFATRAA